MDLMGPLPLNFGQIYLMVMQDAHTKWTELTSLQDKTAESAAAGLMEKWVSRHGCPEGLVSDQGREFVNHTMEEVCKERGHPIKNGLILPNRIFLCNKMTSNRK